MSDTILSSIQRPTRSLPAWATFTSAESAAGTRSQHAQLAGGEKRIRLSVLPSAGWLLGLDTATQPLVDPLGIRSARLALCRRE